MTDNNQWTKEQVELLKEMLFAGKSVSEIAEHLSGFTKNAINGKAHRLGLYETPARRGNKKYPKYHSRTYRKQRAVVTDKE